MLQITYKAAINSEINGYYTAEKARKLHSNQISIKEKM